MDEHNITVTTQLTSKRLKFHKLVSYFFIIVGLLLVLNNLKGDEHAVAWGCLLALYGFAHLTVTRFRIWWNHK